MNGKRNFGRLAQWAAPAVAGVFVLLWAIYSLRHLSPFAATWDEVDFVLALDRFDLLAMQPHFPGYPYFVLAAAAMRRIVGDPIAAYGAANTLLTASSALSIWLLARRMLSPAWSAIAVALVLTAPYLWLQAVRPMSEAAGIALLWWFLWGWRRAMERPAWGRTIASLFLFGLLMGVRLSFAPCGIALLWLAVAMWRRWSGRGERALPRLLVYAGLTALFQLLWVAGLAASEGGLAEFVKLAAAFTAGHFSDWGGGATAPSAIPFAERLLRFAGGNLLRTGMFARSVPLLAAGAALLLAAILRAGSEPPARRGDTERARSALRRDRTGARPRLGSAAPWLRHADRGMIALRHTGAVARSVTGGPTAAQLGKADRAKPPLRRTGIGARPQPAAKRLLAQPRSAVRAGTGVRPQRRARVGAWLSAPTLPWALVVPAGAYALWALLAQNIDKPRHITPLVGIIWLLLLFVFRQRQPCAFHAPSLEIDAPPGAVGEHPSDTEAQSPAFDWLAPAPPTAIGGTPSAAGLQPSAPDALSPARTSASAHTPGAPAPDAHAPGAPATGATIRRWLQASGAALAVFVIALQAAQGGRLVARQAADEPAVYQLADGLAGMQAARDSDASPIVVYTWEETRILEYMHTPVASRRIETFNYFLADVQANPKSVILLTDHVLSGFEAQAGPMRGKVKRVATYKSDPLFDPVYSHITLYEWIG